MRGSATVKNVMVASARAVVIVPPDNMAMNSPVRRSVALSDSGTAKGRVNLESLPIRREIWIHDKRRWIYKSDTPDKVAYYCGVYVLHVDDGASAFHGLESAVKQLEFVNDHRLVALDCLAGEERVQGLSSNAVEVMILGHRVGACTK